MHIRNLQMLKLMTEEEVSKALNVSIAALRRWRLQHRGPVFIKVGSLVPYRPEDLELWLTGQPTGGDSDRGATPALQAVQSSGKSHTR